MTSVRLGDYIAEKLKDIGCKHAFAIPGDPVCAILSCFTRSNLKLVEGLNELNTAYAVEGYSRVNGFGCLVVTDGAGELSALNGVAACFAEQLPLLFIVGTFLSRPVVDPWDYRDRSYQQTTQGVSASLFVTSIVGIADKIDELISHAITNRRPVSLHIPHELQDADISIPCIPHAPKSIGHIWNDQILPNTEIGEAMETLVVKFRECLSTLKSPLLLVGNQVETFSASDSVRGLLESIPGARLMHIKRFSGVIASSHPAFLPTQPLTADAGDVICIGFEMKQDDVSGSGQILNHVKPRMVLCASYIELEGCRTSRIQFPQLLSKYLDSYTNAKEADVEFITPHEISSDLYTLVPDKGTLREPLTISLLGTFISGLRRQSVWDLGRNVNDLLSFPKKVEDSVISQQVFSTIGWALPATIGIMFGNESHGIKERLIQCFIGDGAFQMTMQEISTLHHYAVELKCQTEVYLLDNSGEQNQSRVDYAYLAKYALCSYHRISSLDDLIGAQSRLIKGVNLMHCLIAKDDCLDDAAQAAHSLMRQSIGAAE